MKLKSFWAAVAATLLLGLFAVSCTPKEEEVEEPTLTVTTEAVTVPNAGGASQAITITTNQTGWQAIAGADWISTTQSGNNLTITALPNPLTTDRKAEVLVTAGSAIAKKITVTQTAADIVLDVAPESLVVTNQGGTKLVTVNTNVNDWDVALAEDADWITITRGSDLIVLEIAANNGDTRETKLYASKGSTAKEITITQAGSSKKDFYAPYMDSPQPTDYELLSYEQSNGSILMSYSAPYPGIPSIGFPPEGQSFKFASASPYFHTVGYFFNFDTKMIEEIDYISSSTFKEFLDAGYKEFLESIGFVVELNADGTLLKGVNAEKRMEMLAGANKDGIAIAIFKPMPPEQDKDYPTFKEIPLDKMLDNLFTSTKPGWKFDDVLAYENANGGTFDNNDKDENGNQAYASFTIKEVPEETIRQYWFMHKEGVTENVGELRHVGTAIDNLSYAFWAPEGTEAWQLTREFKALMEAGGYKFIAEQAPWNWFQNGIKTIGVRVVRFSGFADGNPILNIQGYIDEDGASSAAVMTAEQKQALAKRLAERAMN